MDSFYAESEQVIYHFPQNHVTIVLGDFNAKLGKEDIFKPTTENVSLHEDGDANSVKRSKLCYIKKSSQEYNVPMWKHS
jgi:hypothetical protein